MPAKSPPELRKAATAPDPARRPNTLHYPFRDRGRPWVLGNTRMVNGALEPWDDIPERFYLNSQDIKILDAAGVEWINGSLDLEWLEGYVVEKGIAILADLEALSMPIILGALRRRLELLEVQSETSVTRVGKNWVFVFEGIEFRVKNTTGTRRVVALLRQSGKYIGSIQLSAVTEEGTIPLGDLKDTAWAHRGDRPDSAITNHTNRGGVHQDQIAGETERQNLESKLRENLIALRDDEISQAERNIITDETKDLKNALSRIKTPFGRMRLEPNETKKAAAAVAKSIRRFLDDIADVGPDLCRHLQSSIRGDTHNDKNKLQGDRFIYGPKDPIDWHFE